jgi:16S rRNA (guanine(966)-N(2))-methyltransferase RsmD
MRIIAGTLKGRRLQGPRDDRVRPTSDRLRETLFNVLADSVRGARVLDGFGGTAAVAIEAISRGAASAHVCERDPNALRVARANIEACGVSDRIVLERGDFFARRQAPSWDLVFLDPPYDDINLLDVVQHGAGCVAPEGRLVLEHRASRPSPEAAGGLTRVRVLKAGDSALSFYR